MRAVARQSMRRKSSLTPYSRRLSKSVPAPRPLVVRSPSCCERAWLIFSSASARDRNGGYTRTSPGSSTRSWRLSRPNGPRRRSPTEPSSRRPRRTGSIRVRTSTVALAATVTVARRLAGRSDGGSSSDRVRRTLRRAGLVRRHTSGTSTPWVTVAGSTRRSSTRLGRGVTRKSATARTTTTRLPPSRRPNVAPAVGGETTTTTADRAAKASARRQVGTGVTS